MLTGLDNFVAIPTQRALPAAAIHSLRIDMRRQDGSWHKFKLVPCKYMNLALYSVLRLHIGIEDPCWESLHEAVTDEVPGIPFKIRHSHLHIG